MFYFFKTMTIGGRPRLRALSGQTCSDGTAIDTSLNVQADSIMRGSYPIGTIFGSESLELRTHSSSPFYSAGAIYPMGLSLGSYIVSSHIPPKDMTDAYNDFMKTYKANAPAVNASDNLFADIDELEQFSTKMSQQAEPAAKKAPKAAAAVKKVAKKFKNLFDELCNDPALAAPTIEDDGFYIGDNDWRILVGNIKSLTNTMLIGGTGTGKTELVILACQKLGIPCHVYDMGSMQDPISGLLGVHRLEANGKSVFDYAKFTQDIQQPGVILLDELSRAPVTANNILFPCLDSRRELPVEIAGGTDKRSIPVHPECMFIATANVGAEYTGTMSMDRALTGRFFPLELSYMPADKETKVLIKRFGLNASDAANIVAVVNTVRSLFTKQELSATISTRETLMAARLVGNGWDVISAMDYAFLPLFEGSVTDGERSIVKKIYLTR